MRKKTILLDIDEVLNNLKEIWIKLYNEKYNDNLNYINITDWKISNFVKPEATEDIYEMLKTPGLFSEMVVPPEGAIEITKLLSQYYDIYPLSYCRYAENCYEKVQYLEKYFTHIDIENFISCKNKSLIKGDYMIDDYHENLRYFEGQRILFNREHNLFANNLPDNIFRVNNWEDILMFFGFQNDDILNYIANEYSELPLN